VIFLCQGVYFVFLFEVDFVVICDAVLWTMDTEC
jgi:hypothetical protein